MPLSCLYSSTPQFGLTSSHGCLPGTLPLPRPCCLDGPARDCGCCNITPPATFTPLGLCLLALGLCLVSKELLKWSPLSPKPASGGLGSLFPTQDCPAGLPASTCPSGACWPMVSSATPYCSASVISAQRLSISPSSWLGVPN